MTIQVAPCSWELAACEDCESNYPAEQWELAREAATTYLWNWTSKRYGMCEQIVRPCREECYFKSPGSGFSPYLRNGEWINAICGSCDGGCSCEALSSVLLPGPVDSITQILLDGEVLPESSYAVVNHRHLIRTDGGMWPTCQALSEPAVEGDANGAWEVTYQRGTPVPAGGKIAAGQLACEIAKGLCGDKNCRLPQRVQEITRAGMSMTFLDGFESLERGNTGIWLVDSWIASVTRSPKRSRVYSPDLRPAQRITSP